MKRIIGFISGLLLFILFAFILELDPGNPSVGKMAGIAALMAAYPGSSVLRFS